MQKDRPVYLDNNATTPLDPRVLEAMLPFLKDRFGNAASRTHPYGWEAADAVAKARDQVAAFLGADPKEIVWTSGATESDNLAIKGIARKYKEKGNHIITAATEHKAVLDTCKVLEKEGFQVTVLPVDRFGRVSVEQVLSALTPRTILVTLMLANNEVGTLHPIAGIGKALAQEKPFFHCDATQAAGKIPIDVNELGVDLLSLSGHKMYGPKGVGVLYVRHGGKRPRPEAVIHGGGHERGMRSGTLNVPGIVGMGAAAEIAGKEIEKEARHCRALRDRLERALLEGIEDSLLNGHPEERLPNTSNISFSFVEGESLMMRVPEMAVSSGSACTSASLEPSYVLRAMGRPDELAHCSLRFSFGRFNTMEEVEFLIPRIIEAVDFLRKLSPLYEKAKKKV